MTTTRPDIRRVDDSQDSLSLIDVGNAILRSRRMIVLLAIAGGVTGLLTGVLRARRYTSSAIVVPQSNESNTASGLALAASQFGIRIPGSSGSWPPAVFVQLLRSRALLQPIVDDTLVVPELGGRRVAVLDLLNVKPAEQDVRNERGLQAIRALVSASEDKRINGVSLSVSSKWPSVSFAVASRLVDAVNHFILEKRKSQASAERQFVESQASDAERALRTAEDDLQRFLQQNMVSTSPQLRFQSERLQREVGLRQQVYSSLVQSREDARIREVRDTPVLTVVEAPVVPAIGDARNSIQKSLLGAFIGGMLGVLLLYPLQSIRNAKRSGDATSREFFELLDQATPRFLKRRRA